MTAHSRKAAIVPIPIGRNPLTRKGSLRVGRARHARDWDAAVPIPHKLSIRVNRDGMVSQATIVDERPGVCHGEVRQVIGRSWIQQIDLSRHLLLAERFTKGVVKTAKTAERLIIANQIHDPRMLFQRCRNHDQQLATRAQPSETSLEVLTDRVERWLRQKPVLECRFAEAAQQRTPVVVRTERVIGGRIFVAVPPNGQFLFESRLCLVGP